MFAFVGHIPLCAHSLGAGGEEGDEIDVRAKVYRVTDNTSFLCHVPPSFLFN